MAVTKILPRNGGLKAAIAYVLNGDKTDEQILTAHLNCDPGHEYQQMMDTKWELGKMDGRQCYHIIQSFVPGEITPELALGIATEFAKEHLAGYQVVIGTHTDRHHIHSHILFNSVNDETGEKYHCSTQDYYRQIRAVSDRLCREHGLSVILQGETSKSMSYIEWLRQSKGQPTYRSMLEADLKIAMEDANSLAALTKQRTILNVRKKKRKPLFQALADENALAPAKEFYENGQAGFEVEYRRYIDAVKLLDDCGISRVELAEEKATVYEKLANLNREIRQLRKDLKMCLEIINETPKLERRLQRMEPPQRDRQMEWENAI